MHHEQQLFCDKPEVIHFLHCNCKINLYQSSKMISTANYTKLKKNLSLCNERLKHLKKNKTEMAQISQAEIAKYISQGKTERAKIRVEHLIHENHLIEAMEIVEMYCETLLSRFSMIELMNTLDEGFEKVVSSLIWVAPRMQSEVKELKVIYDLLAMKYGQSYTQAVKENQFKTVNKQLMIKMEVQVLPKILVEKYLIDITKTENVKYEPDQAILSQNEPFQKNNLEKCSGSSGNCIQSIYPSFDTFNQLNWNSLNKTTTITITLKEKQNNLPSYESVIGSGNGGGSKSDLTAYYETYQPSAPMLSDMPSIEDDKTPVKNGSGGDKKLDHFEVTTAKKEYEPSAPIWSDISYIDDM